MMTLALFFGLFAVAGQPESDFGLRDWPGNDRAALRIPDDLWGEVREHAGFDGSIGYSRAEMARYGRDKHVLQSTLNLFSDVRAVTRETGRISDEMLSSARRGRISDIVQNAYTLLDVPAARGIVAPDSSSWGVPWIPSGSTPLEALEALAMHFGSSSEAPPVLSEDAQPHWDRLPMPIQRLIVRMLVADAVARPWIRASIDPELIRSAAVEQLRLAGVDGRSLSGASYSFDQALAGAQELWRENPEGTGFDPRPAPASKALLENFDQSMMAYASIIYTRHAEAAIAEFEAWRTQSRWEPDPDRPLRGFRFDTPLGPVRILSSGNDRLAVGIEVPMEEVARLGTLSEPNGVALVVDLGGDDTYIGRIGTPNLAGIASGTGDGLLRPIATVVDLGGNDTYDASGRDGAIACGFFGIGAIFDLRGDDTYIGAGSSISRALY
ncbi:MAG: hypothetical protein ACNA8P_04410, partial [Phycisphaerales bacterium]